MPHITTVLFDADGVLQFTEHDWREALDRVGGIGFAEAAFRHEQAAMIGNATMRKCLGDAARDVGADIDVDEVLDLWRRVEPWAPSLQIAADLRAGGLRCVLATNQQDVRRDVMRSQYEEHMDNMYFSCELGVAKPQREFFERVLRELGLAAAECVFVDDSQRNVDTAAVLGIDARLVDPQMREDGLREVLSDLFVP